MTDNNWQPMKTAPMTGDIIEHVIGKTKDGEIIEDMHYAYSYSGEYQPPFEGWFDHNHREVKPVAWMPKKLLDI